MNVAKDHPRLSVVLPFYSALQCLDITLRSLQSQTLDSGSWEIVVVDDGSGLPVAGVLESVGGDVATRLVTASENSGRSAARNLGASHARGDVLLFHDPDMYIAPDAVQRHYEFHRRTAGSVLLGARYESAWPVINRVRTGDFSLLRKQIDYDDQPGRQCVRAFVHGVADLRDLYPDADVSDSRVPWMWVMGHSLSLPKSMLVDAGMFDENFHGWGQEDFELGYRLYVGAGRRSELFTYDPEAVAVHVPHYADPFRKHATMRRNTEYFLQKHPRFDIEIYYYSSEAATAVKIAFYEEMIAGLLAQGLGNVTAEILDLVPTDAPLLIVGAWPADSPGPPDTTICYDHSRPSSARNQHLLGLTTLLDDYAVEAVVNVDFWRFLMPDDLNRMIAESLRVAPQLVLVQTDGAGAEGVLSSCTTMDFVVEMLAHHRSVMASRIDGAEVLRVTAGAGVIADEVVADA